jgi:hypothetical protein
VGGLVGVGEATEATTTNGNAAIRTVSVEGVDLVSIERTANRATANSTYRKALAEALADGQSKAQLLAERTGSTLGPIQTMREGSGSLECGEAEYEGVMPDFGQGGSLYATPGAAAVSPIYRAKHASSPGRPRQKHRQAKKADVTQCSLSADVGLVYQVR